MNDIEIEKLLLHLGWVASERGLDSASFEFTKRETADKIKSSNLELIERLEKKVQIYDAIVYCAVEPCFRKLLVDNPDDVIKMGWSKHTDHKTSDVSYSCQNHTFEDTL